MIAPNLNTLSARKFTILHLVGARPNFMKVAPVMAAVEALGKASQILVHTGQHYDANMSRVFFEELGLPKPDVNLNVGSGSHAVQTAEVMMKFEEFLLAQRPDLVLVYGDVNSTVAAALVCAKLRTPLGHVEAGLRSFDRTMPEEINRLLTDQVADLLFTPSADGDQNLLREGVSPEKVYLVGNVMIDTLVRLLPAALDAWQTGPWQRQWAGQPYALVTLHRPSNVDEPVMLRKIMDSLSDISQGISIVFPIHPRTRGRLGDMRYRIPDTQFFIIEPLSYLNFLAFQRHATLVITDSGGIQEETTFLGVPCLTVRENTERPITITSGTNTLVGQDMDRLCMEVTRILSGPARTGQIPPLWDGQAGERIAKIIQAVFG